MKLFNLFIACAFCLGLFGQVETDQSNLYKVFNDSKIYGAYCGIAGTHPPSRILMESYIVNEDLVQINEWRKSPNLVIQTYAAEALIRLHNNNLELSSEEVEFVLEMKESEQMINSCRGCIHSQITIQQALSEFEFIGS